MKIDSDDQAKINEFVTKYVDRSKITGGKILWGYKQYQKGKNGPEHDEAVHRVCHALAQRGIPFATEVPLKCGNYLDIACPTHVKQIIEVMKSESETFMTKKILRMPEELRKEVLILHAEKVLSYSHDEISEGVFIL